jgi:aspartyl-tRNA(Asn)/glutamyl-tRNA(Gln) amidotransferase subunit B
VSAHPDIEAVIGLEVHAELLTRAKIFCGCSAAFGGQPNTNVCPVCLGMPGVLPVLNRRVVEFAIRAGLATGCRIAERSRFARKNYFYPDLPKGYQISQYELPICIGGKVEILLDGEPRTVGPHPHPHGGGHGEEHPRRARRREPRRLQPLRRAAPRDRE